jgi:peptidyl-prolyl cis-trans isomerase C
MKSVRKSFVFILAVALCFSASDLLAEGKILAKVGEDVTITEDDLNVLVKKYESSRKTTVTLDEKKNLLDLLINSLLITIEAEKEKLDQQPEIKAELRMIKADRLTREYILTKLSPLVIVKDEEVDNAMKNNPGLVPKETRRLKEIVVGTEKEAEEIYQELKKGGDFSKIASEKSIAPSKSKGGLIGTVNQGQLPLILENTVSQLKQGEYSKPVKTDEGFKILFLLERKAKSPEEIKIIETKVREKVTQLERNKKLDTLVQKKLDELKQKTKIETYYDQVK